MIGVLRDDYISWGGTVRASHWVLRPSYSQDVIELLRHRQTKILAYGCGCSYGDVALNPGGLLVDCRSLDRFISFDRSAGILECEAGVLLGDILAVVCRPEPNGSGWFLPVSPGTRFVTVAGAIANDVHGKNHHLVGTFGRHLLSLQLARSDGSVLTCSPAENEKLFAASIGGLGLTGIILRATIQLRRVEGLAVEAQDVRFDSLEEFWDLSAESDASWEYTAAWIDCSSSGRSLGRGIFSRGRHVAGIGTVPPRREPGLTLRTRLPLGIVNRLSARGVNELYWRRMRNGATPRRIGSYASILYPLDSLGRWNNLYGPRGFFQFQCVVPRTNARATTEAMLRLISASGHASPLAVLKTFGDMSSPGLLSFPIPGTTLAVDFPHRGARTLQLLAQLEEIVVNASGRLYPAKDGAMRRETFARCFPQVSSFVPMIDPMFSSAFARRTGLIENH